MAHCTKNYATKKEFLADVKAGKPVRLQGSMFGGPKLDGRDTVSGPWEYHRWYAQVELKDGLVVRAK